MSSISLRTLAPIDLASTGMPSRYRVRAGVDHRQRLGGRTNGKPSGRGSTTSAGQELLQLDGKLCPQLFVLQQLDAALVIVDPMPRDLKISIVR